MHLVTLVVVISNFRLSFTKNIEKNKGFVVLSLQLGFNSVQVLVTVWTLQSTNFLEQWG